VVVEGVRNRGLRILRDPLRYAGRALGQLPLVFEQVLEEVVAELRRCLRTGNFRTTGDGVRPDASAMLALPAEPLVLQSTGFRLRSDQRRITGAMRLAEGVAAGNQGYGLFVV